MHQDIDILQNGRLKDTLQLKNGTYTIGRAADADIVLADSAVSKTHAILTVDNDNFLIKDSGSANGIFHQGKKIFEKNFNNSFEIEIKPFTLRTAGTVEKKGQNADERSSVAGSAVRNFSINNVRLSLFIIFSITMLLTVLIGYLPLKNKTDAIARQETLKTGILLTRYLAEMNRPFLETGQKSLVRTSPVRLEDGVIYAFMVDAHGRIIAPQEKQGDFVNWDGLSRAYADAKLKIEDGGQNEKIIFYPVIQQNQTIGAAIIGFAWQQAAVKNTSGMGGMVIFLLALLFCISALMCHLLAKSFLNPLKSLYEEVEIAIKGDIELNYKAPYKELEHLARAFNRLLMRKAPLSPAFSESRPVTGEAPAGQSVTPEQSPLQDTTDFPSPRAASTGMLLNELTAPWCVIDRDAYTLERFSENFTPGFGIPECKEGMHIIEALETDIIPAVSQMIDSENSDEMTVAMGDKSYNLRRIRSTDDHTDKKNHVILVFEDKTE